MSSSFIWHDVGAGWQPTSVKVDANNLEEARQIILTEYDSHIYLKGPFSTDEERQVVIEHIMNNDPSEVKPYSPITRVSHLDG
jgi:hypothetical protein